MPRFAPLMLCVIFCSVVVDSGRAQTNDVNGVEQQIRIAVLFSLVPVVVAFSFIVFIFYRAKRESLFKQKEAEFRLDMAELEMKALRSQINPHFIFNCLNSIHHFMHQNSPKHAGEYLVKFSKLIRYALETSSSRMVPLGDDLDALKAYIDLERLRLQSSFDYEIDSAAVTDLNTISIPPMMIQPFVENSIWHGLNSKGNGGYLRIRLSPKSDMMQFIVEDNGSRKHPVADETLAPGIKKTSMGMALIRDRLAVVSHIYKVKADFKMEDCMNDSAPHEGTRITIELPIEE